MSHIHLNRQSPSINDQYGQAAGLIWLTVFLAVLFVVTVGFAQVDTRLLNGVNVWDKPAKFSLSLGLHALTVALGLQLVSAETRESKGIRRGTILFIVAVIMEMSWMIFQASRGEASHFNNSTPFTAIMYTIMGVGAVTLTMVTIFFGWKITRAGQSPMHMATGYGFMLSGILTTIVAGYMSSGTGHSVGGDLTDATGIALFHWSTTGGDLRVPHFAALHIAQALPFLGWLIPDRRVVLLGCFIAIAITGALFLQALMGIPFLAA
jgi:hypothetical protein